MPGLTASRSCQRRPLPNFSAAIFHRESPGFTTTALSFAAAFGATETRGAACAIGACAAGFVGATRTAGGCDGMTLDGADMKTLGRSNGESFTGGWEGTNFGGTGLEAGGRNGITGGFGEASTGASANGRWNSAERSSFCDSFCLRKRRATSPRGASGGSDCASTASWDFSAEGGAVWFFLAST